MKIITLDLETFFDRDYTLSKMTTEAYVRDPRFEVLGLAVRWPSGELKWYDEGVIPDLIRDLPVDCAYLCHHAHFDGLILSHHYGLRPKVWLDTLSMARLCVGNHLSHSLDSLARYYGLPGKNVPYDSFKGKRWAVIPDSIRDRVATGALHDVELTWSIFNRLMKGRPGRDPGFPASELRLIDWTVRAFTEPALEGNALLLQAIVEGEALRKADLLAELGVTADELQSAERFADLLRQAGVDPGSSPGGLKGGKNGQIYAFAKTDSFMKELEDSDDEYVAGLVQARLGVRSTLLETRARRLGGMALRGRLPVYLNYCGAHTTRWSGGDKVNWQNFTRGAELRRAVAAPPGHLCAVVDASQIECRLLNAFAGQADVLDKFRKGVDLYSELASHFYDRKITRDNPTERQLGKVLELASGYGAGWKTIQRTLARGVPPVILNEQESLQACTLYRSTHLRVVELWAEAGRRLRSLVQGAKAHRWGCVELKNQRLYGPTGTWIDYTSLEWDKEEGQYRFQKRKGEWVRVWGGFLVENLVQFLARIHLGEAMKEMIREGMQIVLCNHDEIVALVRDNAEAESWLAYMIEVMSRSPSWMPNVPLHAEGKLGRTYGECK
jgi:DNA polymerase